MADGKKIEVKLVATGGDQAAGEVRKLTTATEQAATATRGFGGMLDSTAPRVDDVEQAAAAAAPEVVELSDAFKEAEANAERLIKSLEETVEGTDKVGDASEDVAPKIDRIITIARAQVLSQISGGVRDLGNKMRQVGKDFESSNPEIASTLQNAALGMESVSGAMDGAAKAAAFGLGPVGMLGGALVGAAAPQVVQAFDDLAVSLQKLSTIQNESAEMFQRIAKYQKEFEGNVLNSKIQETYENQTAALKKLLSEMVATNEVLDAKAAVDKIARDNADAKAIREGADPLQVKAARTQDDAELEKKKIDDGLADKLMEYEKLFELAGDMAVSFIELKNTEGASPDAVLSAKATADAAKIAADEAKAAYQQQQQVASYQKQGIDLKAQGQVSDLVSRRAEQLTKKKEDEARKADLAAQKNDASGLKGDLSAAMAAQKNTAMTRGSEWEARGEQFDNPLLKEFGKKLSDGTDAKEIAQLSEKVQMNMGKLGKTYAEGLQMLLQELSTQQATIDNLKGQIKNGRSNP
jgi:hypothetical protein